MQKKLPADTWLWRFAKTFIQAPFVKINNLHFTGTEKIPEPPFLVIGNHTHFLDPLFVGAALKYPVAWVAAQGGFQSIYLRPLYKSLGAISKQKGVPDAMTIRQIYSTLRMGGVVGIFPEGSVTWDGNFGLLPRGTDKLLEKVQVPIVAARLHGAYSKKPRWADRSNKSRIEVEIEVFNGKEALEFLKTSEWDWLGRKQLPVKGRNRARGFERMAWFCPKCKSFRTISARDNAINCSSCGYEAPVDERLHVGGETIDSFLKNQKEILAGYLEASKGISPGTGTAREWEKDTREFIRKTPGRILVNDRELSIGNNRYELEKIKGFTTYVKRIDEFVYENRVVRLRTDHSSLLIYNAVKFFQNRLSEIE